MTIPVVRPDADCPLCEELWNLLDLAFSTPVRPAEISKVKVEHFLAGVLVWWVARSLAMCDGDARPLFLCLVNALREHGIHAIVTQASSDEGALIQ